MADRTSGPGVVAVTCDSSTAVCSPRKETREDSEGGDSSSATEDDVVSFWPELCAQMRRRQGAAGSPVSAICPICLDPVNYEKVGGSGEKDCVVVPCGHMFCCACIKEWLGQKGRSRHCPVCKYSLLCRKCHTSKHQACAPSGRRRRRRLLGGWFDLSRLMFPPAELVCLRCAARVRWTCRIQRGDWPKDAGTIEPGFVQFVYYTVEKLEDAGRVATYQAVVDAFDKVMDDDFAYLLSECDWPKGAGTIEPGFVQFVYHMVEKLEDAGRAVTYQAVVDAFEKIMDDEITYLLGERDKYLKRDIEEMKAEEPAAWERLYRITNVSHPPMGLRGGGGEGRILGE